MRRGPTKIGVSAYPQTSSCHKETGCDSREAEDARSLAGQTIVIEIVINNIYSTS